VTKGKRPEAIREAAQWLADEQERRSRFAPLPEALAPVDAEEAYAIQDAFVALLADRRGAIVGYKIALSTAKMRAFVGVNEPMAGCLLASTVQGSPARVNGEDYMHLIVEFEIGIRMADDLPAADAPYSRERVAAAVGEVIAALEIADDRGADYRVLAQRPLELIVGNTWNEGAVLGEATKDVSSLDLGRLRGTAIVNGKVLGEGVGAEAMGHPLDALAWIANHQASLGRGLLRGDVVLTGSLVPSYFAQPGDRVRFELEGLGAAELFVH
jgi:2-keto-4-pentenoate hydratase